MARLANLSPRFGARIRIQRRTRTPRTHRHTQTLTNRTQISHAHNSSTPALNTTETLAKAHGRQTNLGGTRSLLFCSLLYLFAFTPPRLKSPKSVRKGGGRGERMLKGVAGRRRLHVQGVLHTRGQRRDATKKGTTTQTLLCVCVCVSVWFTTRLVYY